MLWAACSETPVYLVHGDLEPLPDSGFSLPSSNVFFSSNTYLSVAYYVQVLTLDSGTKQ